MRSLAKKRKCQEPVLLLGVIVLCVHFVCPQSNHDKHLSNVDSQSVLPPGTLPTQAANANLAYYGGHVLSNVQVIPLFWNTYDPNIANQAPGFYTALVQSSWFDLLYQYSTVGLTGLLDGQPGSNQYIGRGTFLNQYQITPANTNTALTDADIQAELINQFSLGLPQPQLDGAGNSQTLYMFHFPTGYTLTNHKGGHSCVAGGFCGYHSTLLYKGLSIAYGVIPDQSPAGSCYGGCGADPNYVNDADSVCSHEVAEAVTDSEVGLATTLGRPFAWYDSSNGEIGDICSQMHGTITVNGQTYTVQKIWSNADQSCVVNSSNVIVPTSVALSASASQIPAKFGIFVTADVATTNNDVVTTGNITFYDGNNVLVSAQPGLDGTVALIFGRVPIGLHQLSATYSGSGNLGASSSSVLNVYQSPRPH